MPLHKESETLTLDLALWLLPGSNQRRVAQLVQQAASPTLSSRLLLEQMTHHPAFKEGTRQLARLALNDPWKLPYSDRLLAHLRWAEQDHHWLLALHELPPLLQNIVDPPLLLCAKGQITSLDAPALAVVGSRSLTPEGRHNALNWSHRLTRQGLNIISGLARGVDGFAHQGALNARQEGASGTTHAVLAHGLDRVYPLEHRELATAISESGALLSEYPLGTAPLARHFPARNRIVTGLSLGVLVIEAAKRSGSLVSARHAMEQGREVMAIPGSVRRVQSEGCNELIRQGAALVTDADDVLVELAQPLKQCLQSNSSVNAAKPPPALSDHLRPLYCLISDVPQSSDQLLSSLGLTAAEGSAQLLELELDGYIEQQPGGWCLSS
ncbi:MAG: DNA-protecting protein DprA [Marinospirillum sp.]|uniref:DNA-processing protein DprA n=1 Tax=Marinospirillum sp. TaxID=2183934 RepID=UPI0019FEC761|nr:DNA-processing protein DprA [Marinospirillum sp.]MBE0506667.1 DNA-protecting protein DprA [Marinospirillum sp.]